MAVMLPDTSWRTAPGLAAVLAALGDEARLVGGCVRDALAGLPSKDIDVATRLVPEDVIRRLKNAGITAVPTGIAHGTITAVTPDGPVEVTTLRRDVATDGRHATISFSDDWREDAARRDFTINALYADAASGEVFDYFGGLDDLKAGKVRFIGDPLARIAEDHLRILRFFRFQARFGKHAPDAGALDACKARANDLMALSRERIAQELLGLLTLPDPSAVVGLMIECGIFRPILPEVVSADHLYTLIDAERAADIPPDPLRRLAALLPPHPTIAEDVGARLRLSNRQRKRMNAAANRPAPDILHPPALAYWLGVEAAIDQLLLCGGDAASISQYAPPKFPISGGQIVARGVKAGPDVARILQSVERRWVQEGFPESARLEQIVADAVAGPHL